MSVVSKNLFDLLGDDESPAPAAPKTAPKKSEPAPAQRNVPGAAPRGNANRGRGNNNRGTHTVTRDDRVADNEGTVTAGGFDGERVPASRKGNHTRDAHTKGPRGSRPAKTSGGHTSAGNGHYRGAKVPAQAGERRQFERRNPTGTTDSQKKVEHGWGVNSGEAELKDEVEGEKDAKVEENAPQTPAEGVVGEAEAPAAEGEAEQEPEEVTKSYEEYLAERAQQNAAVSALGKKQTREVASEIEGKAFVREAIDDFFSGKSKSTEAKAKPKKEKVFIEFDGQFAQPSRPPRRDREGGERSGERSGRGRGQRGGFGGQRGNNRGGARASRPAPINANDTKAFPALGA
ncbi:hypothetical protein I312_105966 [Cryptococcus bacillisporus CA1280]|uniref:Hyaluronan/mRNA-binding protein domain-containing protein n=1 Tax=Cryptococcus bacillisporus CA1280 TaxID=1296109 RepID=A0A0D0VHA9_CRYGA|nr:hypothetical protein I312_04899 [Cryptococcus bacillisporus CA1280]